MGAVNASIFRVKLDEQIDEGVGQLLRRDLARLGVNRVVFRLQDLGLPLHQRVGHGVQLRRRGVTTVVIGGVATNMGVESTACAARTSTAMRR